MLKLQTSTPEYIWMNKISNFISNRKIKLFLLAICLTESIYILSILFSEKAGKYLYSSNNSSFIKESFLDYIEIQYKFRTGFVFYHSLNNIVLRGLNVLITVLLYTLFSLIRILTQYLVNQYGYFQNDLKLKLKFKILFWFIIVLSVLGLFRPLILLHYLGIVLAVIYELIFIIIETRKLRLLLKQRLYDAEKHENHSMSVVTYYQTVYKGYKNFSTILLMAFSFQTISFTIYCLYPIIVTIMAYPDTWYTFFFYGVKENMHINLQSHPVASVINSLICTLEEALFTVGTFLQILPSLILSCVRLYHKMKKMKKAKRTLSDYNSLIKGGIERNQAAYVGIKMTN